jgi:hypothetical protein
MSKILKRPMFRKGGAANEGIMSMAQPRKNYREAGPAVTGVFERLKKFDPSLGASAEKYGTAYELAMGLDKEQDKNDILARVLIEGGLSGLSGRGAGKGTIGGLAEAFREPVSKGLAEYSAMKKQPSQARLMGVKSAIEADVATKIAEAKAAKQATSRLPGDPREARLRAIGEASKFYQSNFSMKPSIAENIAAFTFDVKNGIISGVSEEQIDNNKPYISVGDIDKDGKLSKNASPDAYDAGKVYVDPSSGIIFRFDGPEQGFKAVSRVKVYR